MTGRIWEFFSDELDISEQEKSAFQEFREQLMEELYPEGYLQALLADRIVSGMWKLRRLTRVEAGMIHHRPMEIFVKNSQVLAELAAYGQAIETGLYEAVRVLADLQSNGKNEISRSKEHEEPPIGRQEVTMQGIALESVVSDLEKDLIRQALTLSKGHKITAAGLLGINVRTLRYKLGKLELE